MEMPAIIVSLAALIGLSLVAHAISVASRSVVTALERRAAASDAAAAREMDCATAMIAGVLVASRLGSEDYNRIIRDHRKLHDDAIAKAAHVLLENGDTAEKIETAEAFKALAAEAASIVQSVDVFGASGRASLVVLAKSILYEATHPTHGRIRS